MEVEAVIILSFNPFGVNGFYNLRNNGNRKEWVRDGFRIHSDASKHHWFITPDSHRGKFLKTPRTSDCPSGYWKKTEKKFSIVNFDPKFESLESSFHIQLRIYPLEKNFLWSESSLIWFCRKFIWKGSPIFIEDINHKNLKLKLILRNRILLRNLYFIANFQQKRILSGASRLNLIQTSVTTLTISSHTKFTSVFM